MNTGLSLLKMAAVSAVVSVTMVTTVQAQNGGQRGPGGNPLALVQVEAVQKELKLTEDQISSLSKLADEQRDLSREERRAKMAETHQKMEDILQPEQRERLEQIGVQVSGARALIRPEVIEKLGITKDQKDQLYDLIPAPPGFGGGFGGGFGPPGGDTGGAKSGDKAGDKSGDKGGDKGGPGGAPRMSREEMMTKAMEILTPEQRDQFEKMKGKKFDFDPSQLFQGGRGGGASKGSGKGKSA